MSQAQLLKNFEWTRNQLFSLAAQVGDLEREVFSLRKRMIDKDQEIYRLKTQLKMLNLTK